MVDAASILKDMEKKEAGPVTERDTRPNWQKLGFETQKQCIAHILNFLKTNEKGIIKHGIDTFTTISVGDFSFMLGKPREEIGLQKGQKKKKDSSDDED